jgi:HEAT repeat protein
MTSEVSMRALLWAALAFLACGCAKSPPLAGGKPVSHWVEALHGRDAKARKKAVAKLGNVGPADPAVLPALRAALRDGDPGVRREAVLALLKYGPGARAAAGALAELRQRDRDPQIRAYAVKALARLQAAE